MKTYDKQFWVLILPKKYLVRIKHERKFWVSILTNNFAVSIKSFYMLESFRNNGDIYKAFKFASVAEKPGRIYNSLYQNNKVPKL